METNQTINREDIINGGDIISNPQIGHALNHIKNELAEIQTEIREKFVNAISTFIK